MQGSRTGFESIRTSDEITNARHCEEWLDILMERFSGSTLTQSQYKWLCKTFRCVGSNPTAKNVHFNYARYQWAKLRQKDQGLAEVIDWVEGQFNHPGFNWNNLLKHFEFLANT